MKDYEKEYYDYQTKARGLQSSDQLKNTFERLSVWYESRLKNYIPTSKNSKCLDIPCGYGNFLFHLESKGYENCKGYDLDNKQIDLANLLSLSAEVGDAFEILHESKDEYDLISSMDFIEHLSKDEALKFIALCFNALNDSGVLIIRTPCADSPFGAHDTWNDLTHKWGMTSNLLNAILKMKGYSQIEIIDERPQPTDILNTIRWLIYFPAKAIANIACMSLGVRPPKIWTRSMLAIAKKTTK